MTYKNSRKVLTRLRSHSLKLSTLAGLLVVGGMSSQASAIVNADCSVAATFSNSAPLQETQNNSGTDSAACDLVGTGSVSAGASITVLQTSSSSVVSGSDHAYGGFDLALTSSLAAASIGASASEVLGTAGTVRPGFITIVIYPNFGGYGAGFAGSFTIGAISEQCGAAGLGPGFCGNTSGSSGITITSPFTLGQTFMVSQTFGSGADDAWPFVDSPSALGAFEVDFSFTDANGNPVQAYVAGAPEPASWTLGILGASWLLMAAGFRRKQLGAPAAN